MEALLENFLSESSDIFIASAINRLSHSGNTQYDFYLSDMEIKIGADRQRIYKDDVIAFFNRKNIDAYYEEGGFSIAVNLDRCSFSRSQAHMHSVAMETFRSNNN